MSLLEQKMTRRRRVDKKIAEQLKFEAGGNNKKYKVKSICNSVVYAKESETDHLPSLYYLIF